MKPVFTYPLLYQFEKSPEDFRLRYIKGINLPDSSAVERMEEGSYIHRLINAYFSGKTIIDKIPETDVRLIKRLQKLFPIDSACRYYSERELTVEYDDFILSGIPDLIISSGGGYRIIDWKTGNVGRAIAGYAAQADFYMFLLACKTPPDKDIKYEIFAIENEGRGNVKFEYDRSRHVEFEKILKDKISLIMSPGMIGRLQKEVSHDYTRSQEGEVTADDKVEDGK